MATQIVLKRYGKIPNYLGAIVGIHITIGIRNTSGDDLVWDYDLTPDEVAAVNAAESAIVTILQQQGQLAFNSFQAQITPPANLQPIAQPTAPHVFSVAASIVSVT